jgi:hypothetical protein
MRPDPPIAAVFYSERYLGSHIEPRPSGFEAYDVHDVSLGIYPTEAEAADSYLLDILSALG